ncbi:MAG: asparagine synthase (glutamine-hydrolyzing) [Flavobacterium sp.]|nr:asparagine synthase (glutamine-hydrolyzing) [Flavobacterium sp.]
MCGFLLDYNPQQEHDKMSFINLLSLSQKRGPDAQGYWNQESVIQMGFNRLAILELSSAGEQPMHSFGGRYTLVFNGEIYNHLALRKQLKFTNFRGHSDTETITTCLEEWGIEQTIRVLDGMFALGIYDHENKTLHLVRDFAGIKPLFYGKKGKHIVAASQYDQIIKHPDFDNESIDAKVLKLYLQQHFVPAPFGLYHHTYQVLPGEHLTFFQDGSMQQERFWEFPNSGSDFITDEKEALQLLDITLAECVQDQLLADVPLGAFLSGGVDSPLVAAKASAIDNKLNVFSIGSDSIKHDETERATAFAKTLGCHQTIWNLSAQEVVPYWSEAMASLHEPLADFSILPTYLVSKLAKKDVTVALSGDGGDELFFGYERFWSIAKNAPYQHWPSLLKKGMYGADKYLFKTDKINSVILSKRQDTAHEALHSRFRKNWLESIAPDLKHSRLPESWNVYDYPNTSDERVLLQQMQKAEFYGMMQKTLRKVDLASMENSLEVRVPFLQKKMIEASMRIDPLLNGGGGKQKELLQQLLQKEYPSIPRETVKKGFSVPLSRWIREDLKETFFETLLETDVSQFGFQRRELETLLQDHMQGKVDAKWALFTLYAILKC